MYFLFLPILYFLSLNLVCFYVTQLQTSNNICSQVIFSRPEVLLSEPSYRNRVTDELGEMWRGATPGPVDQIQRGTTSEYQVQRPSIYSEHLECSRPLRGHWEHCRRNRGQSRAYENLDYVRSQRSHVL